MGAKSRRGRRSIDLAAVVLLTALGIAVPHPGCAEQPHGVRTILRGDPAQKVTFEPPYGDLPVQAVPLSDAR